MEKMVERFLIQYEKLNTWLQDHTEQKRNAPFGTRLKELTPKHHILQTYEAKLDTYRQLRNILEHDRTSNGETLAIPTEQALQEFEQIVQAIVSPPKLISKLEKDKTIQLFSPSDPLITALRHMGDNDYSQVVVQAEGKELSLLTVEGVARWLEKQAKDEVISLRDAHIEDAQKYEKAGNVSPISRDATVNDAIDIFTLSIEQNKPRIYALLITEHGTLTEMPLGIIRDSRYFGRLLCSKSATGRVNHRIYNRASLRSRVKERP